MRYIQQVHLCMNSFLRNTHKNTRTHHQSRVHDYFQIFLQDGQLKTRYIKKNLYFSNHSTTMAWWPRANDQQELNSITKARHSYTYYISTRYGTIYSVCFITLSHLWYNAKSIIFFIPRTEIYNILQSQLNILNNEVILWDIPKIYVKYWSECY